MPELAENNILVFPSTAQLQKGESTNETYSSDKSDIKNAKNRDLIERINKLEKTYALVEKSIENINVLLSKTILTQSIESKTYNVINKYITKQQIFDELVDLLSLEPDWDGFDAVPISRISYNHAYKFLIDIGSKASYFETFPQPEGSIGLEIHKAKNNELLLSFSPKGKTAYVVATKGEVHRGRGIRDINHNMPSPVKNFLHELD